MRGPASLARAVLRQSAPLAVLGIKDPRGNLNHEIKTHALAEGHGIGAGAGAAPPHGTMPLIEAVAREKAGHVAIMHEVEAHHHFHASPPCVSGSGGPTVAAAPHAPFERGRAVGGHPGAASPAAHAGADAAPHVAAGARPAGAALRS